MKKKISIAFLALLLVAMLLSCVSAASPANFVDGAGLLTEEEGTALNEKLAEISERQGVGVFILTVDSLDGATAQAYADDYYDGNGCGQDGILFLLSMEARDWAISTHGYGITAFTDAGQSYIMEAIKPDLHNNDFNVAFTAFADQCDAFLTQAATGEPYDVDTLPSESIDPLIVVVACLALAMIISLIVVAVMKHQLKSVAPQGGAEDYIRAGSFEVTGSREMFLYSQVTRTERPKEEESGGSSTHTSSSGETHGGSSGKF